MKVVIQNLQKRVGLGTELIHLHHPDVLLAQEINLPSEGVDFSSANNTSRMGYGTAIYHGEDYQISNVRRVASPRAEVGGFIRKKTTVATLAVVGSSRSSSGEDGDAPHQQRVELATFHGYNGQPFKNVAGLVDHVDAVLAVVDPTLPALFAGDFNTWTEEHVKAVSAVLEGAGFRCIFSWPYPGRDVPLDHAFVRGLRVVSAESYECASDHRGAVLELELSG